MRQRAALQGITEEETSLNKCKATTIDLAHHESGSLLFKSDLCESGNVCSFKGIFLKSSKELTPII